ncbi:MAG: hypothetical protein IPO54_03955 [Micavibrio sp.]|nr:hypothetical protein [Micavibrio sp.]
MASSKLNRQIVVGQKNLKITGVPGQGPGGGNVVIQGNGSSPVFTVNAANVDLDPITVDAFGADYGVVVNAGAFNGFSSIGNTYVNSDIAGIKITGNAVGTATIQGNTFEGSATRGVEVAGLSGDALLLINSNNMGTVGGSVVNGVWSSGAINNGNISIGGNTIVASGAGVLISQPVTNGSNVQITASNNITGIDAVEFSGNVDSSTVNISGGNTLIGTGSDSFSDAIDFRGLVINSNVNINNNTLIQGADDGIQVIGGIRGGTFNINDNQQITGLNGDGIDLLSLANGGGNGDAISNGAQVSVLRNNIDGNYETDTDNGDGANGDGVLVSGNITGATTFLQVSSNDIQGYNNGVHVFGNVNNATVQVNNNSSISAGNIGVWFQGALNNALAIVNGNSQITASEGVVFGGDVNGGFVQVSENNDGIFAWNDGIAFYGNVGSGATINIHDNIIQANQDGGVVGSGIYFGGNVSSATINIGNGSGLADPSNFITVGPEGDENTDGIHFAGTVGAGSDINIDGNRIGYTGTPGNHGSAVANAINGDGIEFAGAVSGNADIDITDNHILAGGNNSGTGDGVKFSAHVGGTANVLVGGSGDANFIDATGNGVEFNGITGGTVSVSDNTIVADENGVEFGAGSPSIEGGADVFVLSNTINATLDGIYVDDDITGAGTTFTAKNNTITAGDDGVDIDNVRNGAVVSIGGAGSSDGNRITADGNGIEFDAGIDATVLIQKNRISAGADGVNVRDDDDGHTTAIDTGANVKILDNKIGSEDSDSIGGHGINVEESVTGGSYLEIARNDIGSFSNPVNLDGIHFGGPVTGGSTVYIHNNNHGIHADDHGIYFGGAINGGATVDIDDNIIGANEDGGVIGSGIFFDGTINAATINIGDGTDSPTNGGASNIIRVGDPDGHAGYDVSNLDGIHFNKEVGSDADINIDGNRLGYNADFVGGALDNERLPGDGIEFRGPVTGNADISITDNHIRADQDGIRFAGIIKDFAKILIGGSGDRNVIDANDNGIEFEDIITGESLVTISYNEVDADNDGILFGDDVNNADLPVGTSEQEIYIANNDIYGGNNGIHFAGEVFGPYHDTLIEANKIKGENGQGIVFDGDIDQARVRIINGNNIEGQVDGVRFLGEVEDGAVVNIDDNTTIVGVDEEAVHFFEEIEEATVTIVGNDNLTGGDHGIEFDGEIDESDVTISGKQPRYPRRQPRYRLLRRR